MPILVERKVFATGDSLAVTLPKAWTRRNQLRPGSKVRIVADGNHGKGNDVLLIKKI